MRSLFSGVSGLKVHQTRMDVIANNISNVNTTAYKSSRVTFSDYFSQTLSSGKSGSATSGGVNPQQIGLGVNIASIDINMTQGVNQRTDRAMDCMISGDGFFIVGKGQQNYFTRDGNFGLDDAGNLVNSSGLNVMGWDAKEDLPNNPGTFVATQGSVTPIQITGDKEYMPPTTTTYLEADGNINVVGNANDPSAPIERNTTFTFFDSIGNKFLVDAKYVWDADAQEMSLQIGDAAYMNGKKSDAYPLTVAGDGTLTIGPSVDATGVQFTSKGTYTALDELLTFTEDGVVNYDAADTAKDGIFDLTISYAASGDLPADAYFGDGSPGVPGKVTLNSQGVTIFDNVGGSLNIEAKDGNAPGNILDVKIQADGSVVGIYSNGEDRLLAQIALAVFNNPSGLSRAGGNLFQATANSGDFNGIGLSAEDAGSAIASGQLEMSNVDIAQEFTDMIITQRGFQANSKSITTSDEMLQELVNLKR